MLHSFLKNAILPKSDGGNFDPMHHRAVLTTEQTLRLRKSFALVERQSNVAALVFYQRLFELNPALRQLFKNNIEDQARKLIDMLGAALSLLEKPAELDATLEALGARHLAYGVKTDHYDTVGEALITMLESTQKASFTPEVRADWNELYDLIRSTMQRGAERAGSPNGTTAAGRQTTFPRPRPI